MNKYLTVFVAVHAGDRDDFVVVTKGALHHGHRAEAHAADGDESEASVRNGTADKHD
jgi:hypothetical protein